MLKDYKKSEQCSDEEVEKRLADLRARLSTKQTLIKEHKLPVLVILEGWGAAGKGSVLGKVIRNIDPRFFKVATMGAKTEDDLRKPFLYRHFVKIPEAGKYQFLDGSWMEEVTGEYLSGKLSDEEYQSRMASIKNFERQLTDNGYLVLKFFFHIDEKEQKKRLEKLEEDKNTRWRVSEFDRWQNKHYEKCLDVFEEYLSQTNQSQAPWYIIDAKDKKWAQVQLLDKILRLDHKSLRPVRGIPGRFHILL